MLFNSIEFVFYFLPMVVFGFYFLGKYSAKYSTLWLVFSSLFFYGWWNPYYLLIILLSICVNYFFAQKVGITKSKSTLSIAISFNILLLAYFKYRNFFVESFSYLVGWSGSLDTLILPLAISFFTFQQIAYLVDSFKTYKNYSFRQYALFVTFFPQLIAGPIVHHEEMLTQFYKGKKIKLNVNNFYDGLTLFVIGLIKKIVIADTSAIYANPVFNAAEQGINITFFEAWSASFAYTFQLYFDFSGYSDMALGLARMFNIYLPLNFNSPYKSLNIIDFWRRWHMTLSRFLRDYLYIPLGGSHHGKFNRFRNLFITMILGGLWHGAGWTFILWGGLHGIFLVINHAWIEIRNIFFYKFKKNIFTCIFAWCLTFFSVSIAWVVFRSESMKGAIAFYKGMFGVNGIVLPEQIAKFLGLKDLLETTGTMPLLGGGSIMGVLEMIMFLCIVFILIFMPSSHLMTLKVRSYALVGSGYFLIKGMFFSNIPTEFLYFQF